MPPDFFALHGDQMKKALRFMFDKANLPEPDPVTFECLARIGIATIQHEHQPFNATVFLGSAYILVYSYDDDASPHYDDIAKALKDCRDVAAGVLAASAVTHTLANPLGLDKIPQ